MITLYIIYYSKMCELFLQDDIIDVLKSKIDIRDYDKLKKVSVKYVYLIITRLEMIKKNI